MMSVASASPVPRDEVRVRRVLRDPRLTVMNFLNEVALQYPEAISFASGRPPSDLFDVRRTIDASAEFFAGGSALDDDAWNSLGAYNRTNGIIAREIAAQLKADEGIDVDPESIIVTVGAQEAMAIVLMGLFEPGRDVLLASDPTYVGVTGLARVLGIDVVPVPVDDAGIDPEAVQRLIKARRAGHTIRALYDIPDFNNPLGTCLPLERRRALLDVCGQHDVLLIEDNPYGMFVYEGERLPTLKALDPSGLVLYIGTYSKTLFPALRIGYLVADQRTGGRTLAEELSIVKSLLTVNTSPVLQAMVAGVLRGHNGTLEPVVEQKRARLRRARDLMLRHLERAFSGDAGISWNRPRGGYFLSLTLPFEFGAETMRQCAAGWGVVVCPMSFFTSSGDRQCQVRLSFSGLDDVALAEGIRRFAAFVHHTSAVENAV